MDWSEYITAVKNQIRNEKAKLLIEAELKDHYEEQKKAYLEMGVDSVLAEKKAIHEFGDPIEVGTDFNRIHRPKLDKKFLLLVSIISLLILVVHFTIGISMESFGITYFFHETIYVFLGIGLMFGICYVDYTILGRYPILIWFILSLVGIIITEYVPRNYGYIQGMLSFLYLFVPVFAGILFQMRKYQWKGLILAEIIGLIPMFFAFKAHNLTSFIHYFILYFILLNAAVWKGWFGKRRILNHCIILCSTILLPFGVIAMNIISGHLVFTDYQLKRYQFLFSDAPLEDIHYQANQAILAFTNSKIFGGNTELISKVPVFESEYILIFIFSVFGIVAGLSFITLFFICIVRGFHIARKQSCHLGFMVGFACTLSILVQTGFTLLSNIVFPKLSLLVAQQQFPFLSYGAKNILLSYTLAGLLLSVYRNTNLVSDSLVQKRRKMFRRHKALI